MRRAFIAVAWAGLLFTLSAIPNLAPSHGVLEVTARKLSHMVLYAIFAALVYRAIPWRSVRVVIVTVASGAFAVSDEWHQRFVLGRSPSIQDVALDVVGACIGVWCMWRLGTRQP